ncbi:LysE family translocator [Zunongwangia endophytica]|uniref:LysE family translocator n=1 Tax=Zunongwangia endophytica TaxID=1808945 RepID=A0ABV8HAG6_9FLAO|nr:LysE family translocator [Zunongwangia endophytica]MDN3596688.1 LysE family translocator [Zunongwangia endophytica]
MLEQLIPFFTATILLTLAPGPDNIYVLVQGMVNGKKHAIITALGLVSGVLVHTTLVAFGVSAIIKQSESIFLIIKCFGAAYLFYLAYKVFKSDPNIAFSAEGIQQKSLFALYRQGFIMNVLNPKITIFFLALLPGFLWEPEGNTVIQFYILGLLFMLQGFLIFVLVAILAGSISRYLQKHQNAGVVLKWTQIVVFIGIGIFILL